MKRWTVSLAIAFSLFLFHLPSPASAVVGEDWQWVNPTPTGNSFNDVVTGDGGLMVAVGTVGTIFTSLDGVTWTPQTSGTKNSLYGITWNGAQFVAVGVELDSFGIPLEGTILTSPDGIIWTPQNSGTTENLRQVTWDGSQFVVVGWNGTILTRPDGINWTPQTSGTTSDLFGVIWNDSLSIFVAVGSTILTSPDGVTWTPQTSGTTLLLFGVTWGGVSSWLWEEGMIPWVGLRALSSPVRTVSLGLNKH